MSAETEEPLTPLGTPAEKAELDRLDRQLSNRIERECASVRAELMERIQGVSTGLSAEIAGLRDTLSEKIDGLDQRIDGLDQRIDGLDQRIDGLDRKIDGLDRRSSERIDALDRKIDGLDRRSSEGLDALDRKDSERLDATRELLEHRIDDRTRQLQAESASLKELLLSRLEQQEKARAAEYSAMKWSIRSMMAAMALLVAMMARFTLLQ